METQERTQKELIFDLNMKVSKEFVIREKEEDFLD